uniref:SPT6_acidic domain-containing protein n=1 Tax=Anisakis simplex TaxID=6269 RepID=A0A0M3JP03_ANISI
LEKELNEMEDEGSEKEETDENDQQEEMSEKKPKKFRKTIVDDRFFSLAEMEEYLDREERQDTSEGFFDDVQEDGREVGAGYRYTDFFGGDGEVDDDAKKGKLKKKKKAVERDGEVLFF